MVDARIDARLEQMIEKGVLAEVASLQDQGYTPDQPGLSSLGAGPFLAHIAGEISLAEAMRQYAIQQKQYAKRQLTWVRNSYAADITLTEPEIQQALAALIPAA